MSYDAFRKEETLSIKTHQIDTVTTTINSTTIKKNDLMQLLG